MSENPVSLTYNISIEGQTIPMPAEIATNDQLLKDALAPYWPGAANAKIMRGDPVNGAVTVTVVKQAGTKGNDGELHVFGGDMESYVAYDSEDLKKVYFELTGSEYDPEDGSFEQVPDDQEISILYEDIEDVKEEYFPENCKVDGNRVTAKAGDWARINGRGFLCGEE